MNKTPKQVVKEKYSERKKLVEAVQGSLTRREGESKDQLLKRLARVSNKKLLRLAKRIEQQKKK